MKILMTGASGFVGSALTERFLREGHSLVLLSRSERKSPSPLIKFFRWDPLTQIAPLEAFEGVEVVIHLAGENIGGGLWTESRKKLILESRVLGTRNLVLALQKLSSQKPRTFISMSGIGYYGDAGDQLLDESSAAGQGFLVEVVKQWEKELNQVPQEVRTVALRTGMVISTAKGGALDKMIPLFRLGLGGKLGKGTQWVSWIHREDLVSVILFIMSSHLKGVVHAVSPHPCTNLDFTHALGSLVHRPTFFTVPQIGLKLILGEMSQLVLQSQRAVPKKLIESGFEFRYSKIKEAIEAN